MRTIFALSLALLALTFDLREVNARLPGVKIRITKKGIDYVNTLAHEALAKKLKTLKIPNQNGKEHHFEWTLTNVKNRGSTAPQTSMALTPGQKGITWSMANLGLKLHADWRVKYKKGWFRVSTSGSVDADIHGVSLKVTISLGADSKGKPTLGVAGCSAQVSKVDVKFHGGTAFIINLFRGTLGRRIRDMMKGQICKIVQKEITVDGGKALSKLKLTETIAKRFNLDYSLIQAPAVLANYLETQHKGEIYWLGDASESPLAPKAFPPLTNTSKMMYLWMSEYTPNTMAMVAHKHNFLRYNLTADKLPPANHDYLNTTCKLACIGTLIPQIGKKYPNSLVEARLATTKAPLTTLTKDSMRVDTQSTVSLYAHTPDKKTPFLISFNVNLSLSLQATIANERLTGKITDHKFKIQVLKSDIGTVYSNLLNFVLGGAMTMVVIPKLNDLTQKGIDLPVTGQAKFLNISITQFDGSFVIATDLRYILDSESLKFQSETSSAPPYPSPSPSPSP